MKIDSLAENNVLENNLDTLVVSEIKFGKSFPEGQTFIKEYSKP